MSKTEEISTIIFITFWDLISIIVSGNNFCFEFTPDHFELDFFDNFGKSKVFHTVLT